MQPQMITKPAFTVVGIKIDTKPMSPEIPALWGAFAPRIDEVQGISETHVSYGLMGPFGESMDYMAGVAADGTGNLPAGMTTWEIPAYTYAVFEATIPTLSEVFGHIYNRWMPDSDYQPIMDVCFERYGETFNPEEPDSPVSIFIPVEEKA